MSDMEDFAIKNIEDMDDEDKAILAEASKIPTLAELKGKSEQFKFKPFIGDQVISTTSLQKKPKNTKPTPAKKEVIGSTIPDVVAPIKPELPEEPKKEVKAPIFINKLPDIKIERRAVSPRFLLPLDNLGSKGRFYPNNIGVYFQLYLTYELDSIASEAITLTPIQLFKRILDGIFTLGMAKEDLTFDDFILIAYHRKLNTLGNSTYTYDKVCPACKKAHSFTYNLSGGFEFQDIAEDTPSIIQESFDFYYESDKSPELVKDTLDLEFKPMTIGRFISMYEKYPIVDDITYYAHLCINKDPDYLLANEFSKDALLDSHVLKLEAITKRFDHSLKQKIELCNNVLVRDGEESVCNTPIIFDIEDSFSLVLPFRS